MIGFFIRVPLSVNLLDLIMPIKTTCKDGTTTKPSYINICILMSC